MTLTQYLADQMLRGPAAGFEPQSGEKALKQAANDPNRALNILFD